MGVNVFSSFSVYVDTSSTYLSSLLELCSQYLLHIRIFLSNLHHSLHLSLITHTNTLLCLLLVLLSSYILPSYFISALLFYFFSPLLFLICSFYLSEESLYAVNRSEVRQQLSCKNEIWKEEDHEIKGKRGQWNVRTWWERMHEWGREKERQNENECLHTRNTSQDMLLYDDSVK